MNNIDNIQTTKAYDARIALGEDEPKEEPEIDEQTERRFRTVESWFAQERDAQAENRFKMARCQDFVDGEQWTQEEKDELEGRGQPAMVFNLVGTTIRWITGTEKRTRVDYSVVGRGKEDSDSAENKTALLKYLNDANRGGYHRSRAFEDTCGAGIGWLEVGIRGDQGEEPLFERYESWRNVWHDRMSVEPDMRDGRYIFRAKWVDLDTAKVYFPEHADALELAAEDHENYYADDEFGIDSVENNQQTAVSSAAAGNASGMRQRVRLVECWYKEAQSCQVMKGPGPYNRAVFNADDPLMARHSESEEAELVPAIRQVMRIMIFVSGRENAAGQMLHDGKSPYWHNRFPLIPIWGYRRKRNNLPYGPVENLIDPQVDLNKRRSKAIFILSTNQVVMDKGAVDDVNILAEEVARPDGIIEKNPGKELRIEKDKQLAQQHVNLMDQDAKFIQMVGGVTDENLGRQTNAISKVAIETRQDQGTTVTADLFDNLRLAMQLAGELKLSLLEQYYDEEKVVRIIGERGKVEFKTMNADPGSSIVATQADFIVDEQAFNKSERRARTEQLFSTIAKLPPEIGIKLLDVAYDMSDEPQREELVARIRQINGMQDNDHEPTPEEIQAMEEEKQAQMAAKAQEDRGREASVKMMEGKAAEATAKGAKAQVEAMEKKVAAMQKALEVAGILQQNPILGQGADSVIADASNLS